jgi:hypothetical protein
MEVYNKVRVSLLQSLLCLLLSALYDTDTL